MFRAIILPILRSARLCVTSCGIMHPRCCRPRTSWLHNTTSCNTLSSAPEDGQNSCPNHVELIGIIIKLLLLHLVGCLYYLCVVHYSLTTGRPRRQRRMISITYRSLLMKPVPSPETPGYVKLSDTHHSIPQEQRPRFKYSLS